MSFDIFFQTSHLSDQTEEAVNPFTGKVVQKPVGETVTSSEREALQKLIASAGAGDPSEFGCYVIDFQDGPGLELFFDGLSGKDEFGGGMAALRSLTPELAEFLYSLADTGNLIMLAAMEESRPIVTSTATAERVVSRWPDAVVVSSSEELSAMLTSGFDGWDSYRDQVVDES
ncbi:hypothetical protein [uncultured Gimesia sp.]|uniref:hypothetical protein n=1 Tax=uncultured Gimesia sp. TaxID=1678688 RepID=UPI0030D85E28